MLLGNLMALRQTQVKRLLAYSSVSHMGYMLLGFGVAIGFGLSNGAAGGFFHLINHALMKGLAFLAAGALLYSLHLARGEPRRRSRVDDLNGAANRYPLAALALSIAVLAPGRAAAALGLHVEVADLRRRVPDAQRRRRGAGDVRGAEQRAVAGVLRAAGQPDVPARAFGGRAAGAGGSALDGRSPLIVLTVLVSHSASGRGWPTGSRTRPRTRSCRCSGARRRSPATDDGAQGLMFEGTNLMMTTVKRTGVASWSLLLSPPVAFLVYIPLVLVILGCGRVLAGPAHENAMKTSVYGSGEAPPTFMAAPGYQPFFLIAFFFAILHLGMLVLGIGHLQLTAGVYIAGLMLALVALMLG